MGVALAAMAVASAPAEERTRGVRIIEGAPAGLAPVPAPNPPAPEPVGPAEPPPNSAVSPGKLGNTAGLSLALAPGPELAVGDRLVFTLSAAKRGYLLLLDLASSGKLTQIFPNLHSMRMPPGATQASNLLEPRRPVQLPNPANPLARFEFVVEPPVGRGTIVALLSDVPVQLVDLPDVPPELVSSGEALNFLSEAVSALRVPKPGSAADLAAPAWSLVAQPYVIREPQASNDATATRP